MGEHLPATVDTLIDWLNETYPHRCPTLDMIERHIWMVAGQRALVDRLLILREMRDAATLDERLVIQTNVHSPHTKNSDIGSDTSATAAADDPASEPDTRISHLGVEPERRRAHVADDPA